MEVLLIFFWWLMFGGTHIIGSSIPVRTAVISRFGLLAFKGLYSLVALATFIPLCFVFFAHKHAGNLLYSPGNSLLLACQFIMLAAIIVLVQGIVTANPMTSQAELTGRYILTGHGIQRLTRHPQNLAFGLFGLAHLLANPYTGDWVFFGGFVIYGIVSAIHQDRRLLAMGQPQVKQFLADTSAIPFAAILTGKQRFAPGEYNFPALAASVVIYILMLLLHPMIFGGFAG